MPRTPLADVTLVGVRAWIRAAWFGAMIAAAVISFVGYLLPAHQLEGEGWHSMYADGGAMALGAFTFIALLALALRKRGFGAGFALGLLAPIAAMASMLSLVLSHHARDLAQGIGEPVFAVGVVGLLIGGAAFVVIEPVLYLTQRHADERATPPPLPVARIHT